MTDEERKLRAQKNWAILRTRVKEMRHKVNFLVTALDQARVGDNSDDDRLEDDNRSVNLNGSDDEDSRPKKSCWQNLVIHPRTSSWLSFWKFTIYALLLYGYFADPYYISFYLSHNAVETADPDFKLEHRTKTMGREIGIDVMLAIDIVFNSVTAY